MTGVWSLKGKGPEKKVIGSPVEAANALDSLGYSEMTYVGPAPAINGRSKTFNSRRRDN